MVTPTYPSKRFAKQSHASVHFGNGSDLCTFPPLRRLPRCLSLDASLPQMPLPRCLPPDASAQMPLPQMPRPRCLSPDASGRCLSLTPLHQMHLPRCLSPDASYQMRLPDASPRCLPDASTRSMEMKRSKETDVWGFALGSFTVSDR